MEKKGEEGDDSPIWAGSYSDTEQTLTKAVFDASFRDYRPTTTEKWFVYCRSLHTIEGIENLNTENVTDMSDMFLGCTALTTIYCNDDWNHGLFHQERQHRHLAGKHHRRHRRTRHLHHGRQADEADTDRAEHPAHERRNNTENRQKTMTGRPAQEGATSGTADAGIDINQEKAEKSRENGFSPAKTCKGSAKGIPLQCFSWY